MPDLQHLAMQQSRHLKASPPEKTSIILFFSLSSACSISFPFQYGSASKPKSFHSHRSVLPGALYSLHGDGKPRAQCASISSATSLWTVVVAVVAEVAGTSRMLEVCIGNFF